MTLRCQVADEGIVPPFPADRRQVAVARQHDRVVGQRVETVADAGDEGGRVAVGEIGPTDAAAEEHVAADDERRRGGMHHVDDVPARVAGNLADLEGEAGDGDGLEVVEQPIGRGLTSLKPNGAERLPSGSESFRAS